MGQLGGDGDTGLGGGDVDEADLVVGGVGVERNLCSSSIDWLIKGIMNSVSFRKGVTAINFDLV